VSPAPAAATDEGLGYTASSVRQQTHKLQFAFLLQDSPCLPLYAPWGFFSKPLAKPLEICYNKAKLNQIIPIRKEIFI
jgi:hypothetical protein